MMENTRNEVSGSVTGSSVQAHSIHGGVHLHSSSAEKDQLIVVQGELNQARQQLIESLQAERNITKLVWILQTVLTHLRVTITRLEQERELQRVELERAQLSHTQTVRQLHRAEAAHEKSLHIIRSAQARVALLESRAPGDPPTTSLPSVESPQIEIGLDMVDQYLDEQDRRLDHLSATIGHPTGRSEERPGHHTKLPRWLLAVVAALTISSVVTLVLSEDARWLRLAIVTALWAVLATTFLATKLRNQHFRD